jgi:transcription elongation factor Elf1
MPLIDYGYFISCSSCDHREEFSRPGQLLVAIDEPSPTPAPDPDAPQGLALVHHFELRNESGPRFTIASAARSGRLVELVVAICANCGTTYRLRRLVSGVDATGMLGCAIPFVGVCAGVWAYYHHPGLAPLPPLVAVVTLALAHVAISAYIRWRYKDRARLIDRGPGCPSCGSTAYVTLNSRSRPLPCPKCGQRTLTFGGGRPRR